MASLLSHAKFGGNRTTHVGVRGWSVMFSLCFLYFIFFLIFENNAVRCRPFWCVVELLPQDIASVFIGRFRCGLQRFFVEEKPFQWREQIWKPSLGGATIRAGMPENFFKIWENGRKVCVHHFDHLEASWKKISTTKLSLGGHTIGARMAEKNKNLRKWMQSLCALLRPFVNEMKENFYHSILPHVL